MGMFGNKPDEMEDTAAAARAATPVMATVPINVPNASVETEPAHEVMLLARSDFHLIFIETVEAQRAETIAAQVASQMQLPLMVWTCVTGMQPWQQRGIDEATADAVAALSAIIATESPVMCVMHGLLEFAEDPKVISLLAQIANASRAIVVLVEDSVEIATELRPVSAKYRLPRPSKERVEALVRDRINELIQRGVINQLDGAGIDQLSELLRGLTLEDIDRLVARLAADDGVIDLNDLPKASDLRSELLAHGSVVTLIRPVKSLDWVAGLDNFKTWLSTRRPVLDARAEAFGLDPAKGVLLTGVPGCGKSFAVKSLSLTWQLPLLKLDAGSLFTKFIGESEANLRRSFEIAEALAPSVLWIDELEKGFSASGGSDSDGGLGFRMVGMLLTWMQERTAPVFLAATANDISSLPPELTRQGRFDEIFFVDLPGPEERAHQFALQLAARGRDWKSFDCHALAASSEGFSGAEIEQAISNAMYDAYNAGHDIDTQGIAMQLGKTVPLSRSAAERVTTIREWGRSHARPA